MLQSITSSCTAEQSHGAPSIGYSSEALLQDLEQVAKIWRDFQSSRTRDAVYGYLAAIFALVEWWTIDKREISRARLALQLRGIGIPEEIEPFAAVIVVTSHPAKLDKRMTSKYSRTLWYAEKYNRAMHLTQVLSIGGVLSEPPPTQEFFRRNRAEIDGLLD